jgi:glycoprotein endo-alpha-1,2-mannosidase
VPLGSVRGPVTSKSRRSTGWHHQAVRIFALALAALVLSPALAHAAGETSIFYYPWWGTPQKDGKYLHWNKNGRLPPRDLASTFYPSRGAYSSRDWKVLSQHMSEIARAGVDEVVSSWWGLGSPEADRLPTLMRAAWKHGIDVAVHLEPYEKWQRTRAIVEADFEYLRGLGVARVYVYSPFDGLIPDAAWLELSARFPSMELWAQTSDAARAAGAGFDGVYTYDVYAVRGGAFGSFCKRATKAGIACSPSVGPGYNASRATPDHRVRSRRAGKTYDTMWRAAIAAKPDRVTITSYNEWHEGTQIEPARRHPGTILGDYASYEGAYGRTGKAAERAYLARTAYWTKTYRIAAAVERALRRALSFLT